MRISLMMVGAVKRIQSRPHQHRIGAIGDRNLSKYQGAAVIFTNGT